MSGDKLIFGWVLEISLHKATWMTKNRLVANQKTTLHMNGKNTRNHNRGFNNNYIQNMTYSWGVRPLQWALGVWARVNIMACISSPPLVFLSLSWWVRNNGHIFLGGGNTLALLVLSVLPINGLLAWGNKGCCWLKPQQSWWQNMGQCLLVLGMKDSSDFAEDLEVRQACPNTHATIRQIKTTD